MQYIVLDMEWNQPWPGSYSAKKPLPSPIRGEIIQIGAVRMLEDQRLTDEFQVLIRPKYYKKMNRNVKRLTALLAHLLLCRLTLVYEAKRRRAEYYCSLPRQLKESLAIPKISYYWLINENGLALSHKMHNIV